MNLVRVTMYNVHNYIGCQCIYDRVTSKTRCIAKILSVSATGKSIKIDECDGERGRLQTVSRAIYIFQ